VTGKVGSLLEVGTGFHQELTGRENIYLSGAILGMKRREIDTKLDRIVDFSGVERFLDTPLKFYSTGMYLRIAFSVAAHLETDVMLVDEVLAVGDAEFQKKCLRKMKELAREGRTVLFVSHNLPAVASLCSRGLLLDAGRLVYQGSIQETINAYGRLIAEPEQESAGFPINAVQISGLKLEQSSGDLTSEEWWSICFRLNLGDTFEHVALQLGITTYDGRNLALDLIDSGSRPKLRIAGSRKVRIRIPPLWLKPQTYTARIKVYVNRSAGEIERFFSDWLTIHVNASSGETVQSDALLAPLCEWTIGSISESDE
jgi:lipopolysaccharide transport system ATP-binding protein